jgi:hypothetical protein
VSEAAISEYEGDLLKQICSAWAAENYELQSQLEDQFYTVCGAEGIDVLMDRLEEAKTSFLRTPPLQNETFLGVITEDGTYLVRVETADGHVETLPASPHAKRASPNGFSWGYGGSGPSALALSILYRIYRHEDTLFAYHNDFKFQVLNKLDTFQGTQGDQGVGLRWRLTTGQVHTWLSQQVNKNQ